MNRKGYTLIELIAVIAILAIVMVIGVYSVTSYMNRSKQKAFDVLINSFEDGVLTAYTSCLTNPKGSDFCRNHSIPDAGEFDRISLGELENDEFVEKMKNPWNTSEKCESNSYIIATRTSDDNISFNYKTCLQCGNHISEGCTNVEEVNSY